MISIADDGAGINREKVLQKAIDKGLVAPVLSFPTKTSIISSSRPVSRPRRQSPTFPVAASVWMWCART